ncbi:hypothetical protein AM493_09300 [Flavobacterium akiainvivens]|uniref:Uncharacterized protein n=1 Tax=Flavobacterium akiainvivens TaxID=1202724 RepID=A0A0M8M9A7_9FLAO|nr:hypothetical protein AM493_09300 [Flavobacterium akiainvivens]
MDRGPVMQGFFCGYNLLEAFDRLRLTTKINRIINHPAFGTPPEEGNSFTHAFNAMMLQTKTPS